MELFSINKFLNQSRVSFSYLLIIYHQLAGHMLRNRPATKKEFVGIIDQSLKRGWHWK